MPRLIPDSDIKAFLPTLKLSEGQLASINLLVRGWLRRATGQPVTADPLQPDDPLYGAAFELIKMTAVNPEGLASVTNGPTTRTFPGDAERRAVLADVTPVTASGQSGTDPTGCFPPAPDYPDPAIRTTWTGW